MTQLRLQGAVMDSREILALYQWTTGDCFRCARVGVLTTHLGDINPPGGGRYEIRVCEGCALELEDERRRFAERTGGKYEPGRLGPSGRA